MSKFADYSPESGRSARLTAVDGLRIRASREPDLALVAEIAAEREGESPEEWLSRLARLEEEIRVGRAELLVAELGGVVIGYGTIAFFSPPAGSPDNVAPEGWYLAGLVVRSAHRRRGVGHELTLARLAWIAARGKKAYYFANEHNRASIELHAAAGFNELSRDFHHPAVRFSDGGGILFECDLRQRPKE